MSCATLNSAAFPRVNPARPRRRAGWFPSVILASDPVPKQTCKLDQVCANPHIGPCVIAGALGYLRKLLKSNEYRNPGRGSLHWERPLDCDKIVSDPSRMRRHPAVMSPVAGRSGRSRNPRLQSAAVQMPAIRFGCFTSASRRPVPSPVAGSGTFLTEATANRPLSRRAKAPELRPWHLRPARNAASRPSPRHARRPR
jgi:hypothetical protein